MAEGATAIVSKRVCALSSACKYVLWSDLALAEIARRFGYTDGAHLHHEFRIATGGGSFGFSAGGALGALTARLFFHQPLFVLLKS